MVESTFQEWFESILQSDCESGISVESPIIETIPLPSSAASLSWSRR
jgi:hypothetical protein